MIYLWYNTEEKRLKMGQRVDLKNDYLHYDESSISVVNQLKSTEQFTAMKIIKRFEEMNTCLN
ncbi:MULTISPECIES: hypothetical protein [Reichenbachiella]|uniref:Uncharacterized protein n=1 Tax=Reichenbachiella agariperforans TaxID=156994 RepID=A0A1M6Q6K6_REIAG|nr:MULTISPECIES: hypothetical protein [Reichenbachiella]MBU2914239.1 hypothetical protein [Reichenbachiella agariperforans]RJE72970.1 hypothetical protein BGP76_03220 [Reichenbachiella sp. MSK19-1]SHK15757.1 hypothetical protein SAMN04488028_103188 [Reichenbachiella agariperforans]